MTDHIEAIDLVFHKGKSGDIYNIGGNTEVRNIEIAKKLIKLTGRNASYIDFVADRKGHDYRYAINTKEIQKSLMWKPKVTLDEGLKRTLVFYKKQVKKD